MRKKQFVLQVTSDGDFVSITEEGSLYTAEFIDRDCRKQCIFEMPKQYFRCFEEAMDKAVQKAYREFLKR